AQLAESVLKRDAALQIQLAAADEVKFAETKLRIEARHKESAKDLESRLNQQHAAALYALGSTYVKLAKCSESNVAAVRTARQDAIAALKRAKDLQFDRPELLHLIRVQWSNESALLQGDGNFKGTPDGALAVTYLQNARAALPANHPLQAAIKDLLTRLK